MKQFRNLHKQQLTFIFCFVLNSILMQLNAQSIDLVPQTPHNARIEHLSISSDGKFLYSLCPEENELKTWDALNGILLKTIKLEGQINETSFELFSDNSFLIRCSEGSKLFRCFYNANQELMNKIEILNEYFEYTDYSSNTLILSHIDKYYFEVWNVSNGQKIYSSKIKENSALSHQNNFLLFEDELSDSLRVLNLQTRRIETSIEIVNDNSFVFSASKYHYNNLRKHVFILKRGKIFVFRTDSLNELNVDLESDYINDFSMDDSGQFAILKVNGELFLYKLFYDIDNKVVHYDEKRELERHYSNFSGNNGFILGKRNTLKNSFNSAYSLYKDTNLLSHFNGMIEFDKYESKIFLSNFDSLNIDKYFPNYFEPNSIYIFDIDSVFSKPKIIYPDKGVEIFCFKLNLKYRNFIVAYGVKNSKWFALKCFDFSGKILWMSTNSKNSVGLYDESSAISEDFPCRVVTKFSNTGFQVVDVCSSSILYYYSSLRFKRYSETINRSFFLIEQLDTAFILKKFDVSKLTFVDSILVKPIDFEEFSFEYPIDVSVLSDSSKLLLFTSLNIYLIDCKTGLIVSSIRAPDDIFFVNASLSLIKDSLIIVTPFFNPSVLYYINKENQIKKVNHYNLESEAFINFKLGYNYNVYNSNSKNKLEAEIVIKSITNNKLVQKYKFPFEVSTLPKYFFVSPDGMAVVMYEDNIFYIFKHNNIGEISLSNHYNFDYPIKDMKFSSTSDRLFILTGDSRIHVLDMNENSYKHYFIHDGSKTKRIFLSINNRFLFQELNGDILNVYLTIDFSHVFTYNAVQNKTIISFLPNKFYLHRGLLTNQLKFVKFPEIIGFDQLDIKYNRPDKVLTALGEAFGNPDTALIKSYYRAWQKRVKKLGVDTTSFKEGFSFPESDIQNREEIAYEQTQSELKLRIVGKNSESALDRFNVWVNEVPVFGQRGISIRAKGKNSVDTVVTVQLSEGENKIETSVLTVGGIESYRIPLFVKYTPAETKPEKLYFVGIGVDRYNQSGHDLKYSVKDIRDLSRALKEKHGNNLIIDTLFDQQVSREGLMALKKKLLQSGVNDKVIVSFSGHGLLDKNYDYYLATHGVDFQNPAKGGIPYEDLEWLLDSIPARKKLLLLDACHSGEVDKEELVAMNGMKDKGSKGVDLVYSYQPTLGMKNSFELMQELFANVNRGTGATVISASGGTQFAHEDGALRNGVFTYSILEFMEKKPEVTVSELKTQVGKRVVELTNGLQKPTSRNETLEFDWRVW